MLQQQYGAVSKLGLDRVELLKNCWDPTVEELKELSNILVKASQRYSSFVVFIDL